MKEHAFKLWLEYNPFDVAEPDLSEWDMENEFCNIGVDLLDGRCYGINVWTYKYVETAIAQDVVSGENCSGNYVSPPDLLVKDLTKACIEAAIADLLGKGDLEWLLNPSVFSISFKPPWISYLDIDDLGDALEKDLKMKITMGHVLYNRNIMLLGLRNDTDEIAVQLDDRSIALIQKEADNVAVIKIFSNEENFWRHKLRNDILNAKD